MKKLFIVFVDPFNLEKKIEVSWRIGRTPGAIIWANLLESSLNEKKLIHPRFTGFLYGPKNMEVLAKNLNACIEKINQSGTYRIEERASHEWDQDFSNKIHHHFEVLCGTVEKPTDYLLAGDLTRWHAVLGLNQIIHDMEALEKAKVRQSKFVNNYFSSIIVQVYNSKRFKIPDFMNEDFSISTKFGAIHLNYSQIGKTWWEVFLDQDEEIFPEAIVPHFAIDGGFDIFFGEFTISPAEKKKFDDFLISHGQDPNDKKLRLGYHQVAELEDVEKYSREEWRRLIGEHSKINYIKISENEKVIAEQVIDYPSPYEAIYNYCPL